MKLNLHNINNNNETINSERKKANTDRGLYENKQSKQDLLKSLYIKSNTSRKKVKSPVFPNSLTSLSSRFNFTKEIYSDSHISSLTPRDFVVKKHTKNIERLYSAQKLYNSSNSYNNKPHIIPIIKNNNIGTTTSSKIVKSYEFKFNQTFKSPRLSTESNNLKQLSKTTNKLKFLSYKDK